MTPRLGARPGRRSHVPNPTPLRIVDTMTRFGYLFTRTGLVIMIGSVMIASTAAAFSEGDRAPDFTLTDLVTEEPFGLSQFAGRVVCLNFWAYW